MRSLSAIAGELGNKKEANEWLTQADKTSELVNQLMWDEKSRFYYSINMKDHSFFFMDRDLKRQEIIGFLPLWAKATDKGRADMLVQSLTDSTKFWRKYGVPTLAADDEWFSPYVDYCCKWNGPVWLLWDYMVFDGLVNYGYHELAVRLADKMVIAVSDQLTKNHNFWESYSPDNNVLDCPPNYIWDAIMAKVLIEKYSLINNDK
jgi:glycogen debranching enzyme